MHFPACYVKFPISAEHRRAAFYLAAEEYIARQFPPNDYLFSWQLSPTVVIGRNQVAHQELDLDFCKRERIDVVRRKSGGGAIFADEHNIMWSLITGESSVESLFYEYAQNVAGAIQKLGVEVNISGRNDILLKGGGKICGNAFYHLPQRNIVHGTMLYNTCSRLMEGALHPNAMKMQTKGIRSVRSRIALLKDYLPFGVNELRLRLQNLLTNRSISLQESDVKEIEKIEQTYYNPNYIYGRTTLNNFCCEKFIESCGTLNFYFSLQGTIIKDVALTGDFFEIQDAEKAFKMAFVGIPLTKESINAAIEKYHPEQSIRNLSSLQCQTLFNDCF